MTEPRRYPEGVTSWIDLTVPDVEVAQAFYGGLFGWEFSRVTPPDSPFGYWMATLDGQDAAGFGAPGDDPPVWTTYIAVDEAEPVVERIRAAGGGIVAEPDDGGPGGRSAACTDPQGAPFRLWQARRRLGAQVVNTPGAWNFSDLHTPDPTAAADFYTSAFGWEYDGDGPARMIRVPGFGAHLAATVDPDIYERQSFAPAGFEDVIGGLVESSGAAWWDVVFTVADRDESAALAERLGATVLDRTEDEWTRKAVITDPFGARLTLSQFTPPS